MIRKAASILLVICSVLLAELAAAASLGKFEHIANGLEKYHFEFKLAAERRTPDLLGKQQVVGLSREYSTDISMVIKDLAHAVERVIVTVDITDQDTNKAVRLMSDVLKLTTSSTDAYGLLIQLLDKVDNGDTSPVRFAYGHALIKHNQQIGLLTLTVQADD